MLVGWKARQVLAALRRRSPAVSRFRLEEGPTRLSAELLVKVPLGTGPRQPVRE